jgi:hypothetical protein
MAGLSTGESASFAEDVLEPSTRGHGADLLFGDVELVFADADAADLAIASPRS